VPIRYQQRMLDNGLTILGEIDPGAHTAAAGFFVRTGARDEASSIMGVSHFLEHMMFKGTHDLSSEELNRRFDAIGARNNAFTSNEMTCFYAHVLPEHLREATDLLGRMLRPALRSQDFDTEKNVILEEIAMYADNPFWMLYEAATERHFGTHPLSHRVLGTNASITQLMRDQMQRYFDDRYSADNTVVAVAGKLDFDAYCAQLEALCSTWQRTSPTRNNTEPSMGGGEFTLRSEKVNRGYLLALMRGPAFDDDRRYAAGLLSQVLGAPENSLLHWALVEPGLAEEAQASFDPQDGVGQFYAFASCDPERLDDVWAITQQQLAKVRDSLTQDDLTRLVAKAVTGATIAGERPHDRMHRLGRMYTYLRTYWPLEDELAKLARVTLDDVRDICDAFPLQPVTVGRLIPA
jgi:predicted Zn-dependent peptidase